MHRSDHLESFSCKLFYPLTFRAYNVSRAFAMRLPQIENPAQFVRCDPIQEIRVMPGAKQGISDEDPTIAQLLKPHGYVSGQFGKNHLGDRNGYLPTVHGFDEYAGVLYHLNALEEPENVDYPKDPEFFAKFGPRDVIYTWATDKFDKTEDSRFAVMGKQRIKDLGKMTIERMNT